MLPVVAPRPRAEGRVSVLRGQCCELPAPSQSRSPSPQQGPPLPSLGLLSPRPPARSLSPGFSREPAPAPRPVRASQPLPLCPERGGDGHRLGSTRARGQQEAPRVAPGRCSARLPPSRRVRVAEPALMGAGAPLLCVPPAHLPLAQPVARRSGPAPGSRVPVRGRFFPPSPAHVCARSHDTQLSGKEERVSPPPLPPPHPQSTRRPFSSPRRARDQDEGVGTRSGRDRDRAGKVANPTAVSPPHTLPLPPLEPEVRCGLGPREAPGRRLGSGRACPGRLDAVPPVPAASRSLHTAPRRTSKRAKP